MPSREQRHRPHLFSLSLSLPSPDLRGTKNLSSPVPFLFPRSRHRWRDEIVQYYTLNYPYPLSLSLSREYGEMVVQIGSLCYVRALQFQGYRFVTPFR